MHEAIPAASPLAGFFWTYIVPPAIFTLTAVATWLLYRHFANKGGDQ